MNFVTICGLYQDLLPEKEEKAGKKLYMVVELKNGKSLLADGITGSSSTENPSKRDFILEGYWTHDGKNAKRVWVAVDEDFVASVSFSKSSPFPELPEPKSIGFQTR
jgi:hypothetical protein